MSTPSQVTPPTVPAVTGNPGIDSLIRSALIAGAAALTGIIVTWLNAHGFSDPNLNLMIGGAILTVLTTAAVALWGYLRGSQIGRIITTHEVAGVNAGMALAASGEMKTMVTESGITAPVLATPDTAKAIIKNFAPVVQEQGTK